MNIISKLKGNKTLMNGTMFSLFSFINRGIGFLLLIILARYIMPAEYGRLSLFNTIVQFLGYFIALSCQGYFAISFFQRKGELFRQDTTSIVLIMTVCTTILSIVLLFCHEPLARFAELPHSFLWFALIISFTQVFYFLYTDLLRVEEKVARYGIVSCGFALVNFVLSIYLVIDRGLDWEGRVYSHLICAVVSGIIGVVVLAKKRLFTRHVTWEGTKMILLWGIPLIPHKATSWIKQGCDRFIINGTHTIEDVGLFSFALTLTSIIIMIGSAFNSTNSVTIYQVLSSDLPASQKRTQLKKQSRNILFIYTIGYILVLIGASVFVPLLLPKYSGSLTYFWITSVSGYLQCLYYLFVNYLFYYHKNKNIMLITFITALLHLGLSLLLTRYSLYLTSIIYIVSQSVVVILIANQSLKIINEKIK